MAKRGNSKRSVQGDSPAFHVMVRGESGEANYPISKPVTRIGRRSDNDIVISHQQVSGYHARFQRTRAGDYEIIDQNSQNGILVNGKKTSRIKIQSGDVILFGDTEIVVKDTTQANGGSDSRASNAGGSNGNGSGRSSVNNGRGGTHNGNGKSTDNSVNNGNASRQSRSPRNGAAKEEIRRLTADLEQARLTISELEQANGNTAAAQAGLLAGLGGGRKAKKYENLSAAIEERGAHLKQLNEDIAAAAQNQTQRDVLRREVDELKGVRQHLQDRIDELEAEQAEHLDRHKKVEELKQAEAKLLCSKDRLQCAVQVLEDRHQAVEEEMAQESAGIRALRQETQTVADELAEKQAEGKTIEAEIDRLHDDLGRDSRRTQPTRQRPGGGSGRHPPGQVPARRRTFRARPTAGQSSEPGGEVPG